MDTPKTLKETILSESQPTIFEDMGLDAFKGDEALLGFAYKNHSGEKFLSPLALSVCNDDSIADKESYLAKIAVMRFGRKWQRLYDAIVASDYDPLSDYSLSETENVGTKVTTSTSQRVGTYGFNSDTAVGSTENGAKVVTGGDKADNERTLKREGKIGGESYQAILEHEIELRKWDFYEEVFSDLDKILAQGLY